MLRRLVALRDFFNLTSQRQWFTIALIVLVVVFFEVIEHTIIPWKDWLEMDLLRDIFFYGALTSIAASYIIIRMERLTIAYQQSKTAYDILQRLIDQLTDVQDDQEASAIYMQALRTSLPFSGAQLLVYNPVDARFKSIAGWPYNSSELTQPMPRCGKENCFLNTGIKDKGLKLTPADCVGEVHKQSWPFIFCYPLTGNDRQVGILYLYHTEAIKLSAEQKKLLLGMSSELVVTLDRIEIQQSLDRHKASQASIQQRIARDMHATLGHNLAYLRMKLDQMAGYRISDASLTDDLHQLRDTADEAYQQMRDLLVALTPEKTPNLRSTLTKYARRVADRAGFELDIQQSGKPRLLLPIVLQQAIIILREALGNIERHARARHVTISLDWHKEGLEIQITDDGRGFNASHPPADDQLGLRFMQERAREVNGAFAISSMINSGTKISLQIPYQQEKTG
jgi:signal transduction histidine kinase